ILGIPMILPDLIPLSNVKEWTLEGDSDLLAAFDLSGAQSLKFKYDGVGSLLLTTPLPSHLTTLSLEGLSMQGCISLPNLTSLRLFYINLGTKPLHDYLRFPRLKELHLVRIYARAPDENSRVAGLFSSPSVTAVLDEALFKDTSSLEYLSLGEMSIPFGFAQTLGSCLSLRALELEDCSIPQFIPPFIKSLVDVAYLPHLKALRMRDSWPHYLGMSYRSFIKECEIKRPAMDIFDSGPESNFDSCLNTKPLTDTNFDDTCESSSSDTR
ncbi:hypothetical protein CPB86DRAFT_781150, partial [Serendipita vermifera]